MPTEPPAEELEEAFDTDIWAYPNPFENSVSLEVELSRAGPVSLLVYDSQMRVLARLVQGEELGAGIHKYVVDLGGETAGIYLVQLVADGQTFTEKIIKQ